MSITGPLSCNAVIEQIVDGTTDLSSLSKIGQDHYWNREIRLHLSPERANVLRHLDFSGLDVLEIGAGMGSVSRFLGEHARSLVCVESDASRLAILVKRLAGLNNWEAVGSLPGSAQFDVVCVLGIGEEAALAHAAEFLKPGGVLLIAADNRYGIKYWAGAPVEDAGQMFDGICGFAADAPTLYRARLFEILQSNGFICTEEYYPWPDYRICQSVVSKSLAHRRPELAADIAADAIIRDHPSTIQYFPTSIATRHAIAEGRIGEIANSFFLVTTRDSESPVLDRVMRKTREKGEVGWHYSFGRKEPCVTAFRFEGDAAIVSKSFLAGASPKASSKVRWQHPDHSPVLAGAKVSHLLKRAAYYEGREAYEKVLLEFLEDTLERFQVDAEHVAPEAYDAVPHNTIRDENGDLGYFDLEWILAGPMKKDWLVLRTVLCERRSLNALPADSYESLGSLFEKLCLKLGLSANMAEATNLEAEVQAEIANDLPLNELQAALARDLTEPLRSGVYPRSANLEMYLRQAVTHDNVGAKLQELETEVDRLRSIVNRRSVRFVLSLANRFKRSQIWSVPAVHIAINNVL